MTGVGGVAHEVSAAPRDPVAAARALSLFMVVGGLFIMVLALAVPQYAAGKEIFVHSVAAAFVLGGVAVFAWPTRVPRATFLLTPMAASVVMAWSNITTHDATAGSQVFYLWPVLCAGMFLRPTQCVAIVSVSAASITVAFSGLLPASEMMVDVASLTVMMTVACAILIYMRGRERRLRDALARQAYEDQLTGLANRRAFERALNEALDAAVPLGPVSLLTLDLDLFK